MQIALSIAGSDPSGGAGIQADLKTFHQFGVYGEAVVTLLTVQNTRTVSRVECMAPDLVISQLFAVLEDIPPHAAKLGALGSQDIVEALAEVAGRFEFPLVIDPVMISKHGAPLIAPAAVEAMRTLLLPHASLVTPNTLEAAALTGMQVDDLDGMRAAALAITRMGPKAVLIKGGHLSGNATDLLLWGGEFLELPGVRVQTPHTHGTGCTYSAAITAGLAQGEPLTRAVQTAKRYISTAIRTAPGLGSGSGPVNHFSRVQQD